MKNDFSWREYRQRRGCHGRHQRGYAQQAVENSGDGDSNDKQKKGKPERIVDQNKQVNDAARDAKLNLQERKEPGRAVEYESRGQGGNLGYEDIREIAELIEKGQY